MDSLSRQAARAALALALAVALPLGARAQPADLDGIGYVLGSVHAPIEIVEFADFACTFCGQFARETMPAIERDWIRTGRARFRFVPFHLSPYKPGRHAARAAACAARQDAFWPMHDTLYERQKEWLGRGGQKEKFVAWAAELGVDEASFLTCWDEDPGKDGIDRNTKLARSARVRATPTFFVGDKRVEGALSIEDFTRILEGVGR